MYCCCTCKNTLARAIATGELTHPFWVFLGASKCSDGASEKQFQYGSTGDRRAYNRKQTARPPVRLFFLATKISGAISVATVVQGEGVPQKYSVLLLCAERHQLRFAHSRVQ